VRTEELDVVDARRAPRIPIRLLVAVRHRHAAWGTETEDLGPRGCQLISDHPLPRGSEVALAVSCPPLGRAIAATGRVTWCRPDAPARIGIAFDVPVRRGDWFDALLAADPRAALAAARAPRRLRPETRLYLGEPPAKVLDFSDDERALLGAICGGASTAGEVADRLAPRFHRARGVLFSLLVRRLVRLTPGHPGVEARWRAILASLARPAPGAAHPQVAQRLYGEAIAHLRAGRTELAVARFREALEVRPGDTDTAAAVARLERWR
jgi:hypothetical protein